MRQKILLMLMAIFALACSVNAKGSYGITGNDYGAEHLVIDRAHVTAESKTAAISDFATLTLNDCKMTQPEGAACNAEKRAACDKAGNIIKSGLVKKPFNSAIIDNVVRKVVSHEYKDKGSGNFYLYLYLSEDKNDFIVIQGKKALHTGKDIDLTKKEGEHEGFYWGVDANLKDNRLFGAFARPGFPYAVFTTGTMRLDGDPAGEFSVVIDNGRITDPEDGDGKEHTISLNYSTEIEIYDLKILGEQVTSSNCDDLSVIDGVTGKVSYDPSTKTLTLEDATIGKIANEDGIESNIYDFNIEVKGEVNVSLSNYVALRLKSTTIKGTGTLNLKGRWGIVADYSLTISECTVNAKGSECGIYAFGYNAVKLIINKAYVTAEGGTAAISKFWRFTLNDCEITQPEGAAWNAEKRTVCDEEGNVIKSGLVIKPLNSAIIDGVVRTVVSHEYVDKGNGNFYLYLYLSEDKNDYIEIQANKELHTGKDIDLTKREEEHEGYYWYVAAYLKGNILFCSFAKPGSSYPFFTTGTMKIDGDPAEDFSLLIDNGRITAPGYGDGEEHTISLNYSVEIERYDLLIAGEQVTSDNRDDLSVIDGVTGNVSYDPITKTLTLEDAAIESGDNAGIESDIDNINIEVIGNVNVTSSSRAGLSLKKTSTISGTGTLNTEGRYGIIAEQLTITDCSVNAKGNYGITSNEYGTEHLLIERAHVTAEGTTAAIADFVSFTLNDCEMTQPEGVEWNAEKRAVCDEEGNRIKGKVVIEPVYNSVIDGVVRKVVSHGYEDKGNGDFKLYLYLTEDGGKRIEIQGNTAFHIGKDIDLTKREEKHEGYYWGVTAHLSWSALFNAFAAPRSLYRVFTTGTMRIDGDLAGEFSVVIDNGRITDSLNGDGKEHTISLHYRSTVLPDAISQPKASDKSAHSRGTYNIAGQRVNDSYKGIVIKDGRKILNK
jgi:hypothetical protein